MTTGLELRTLLQDALTTERPIRFSYPGSEYLSAKVSQLGSTWVEVLAFDSTTGKFGERWLKIALMQDIDWSPSDSQTFVQVPDPAPASTALVSYASTRSPCS